MKLRRQWSLSIGGIGKWAPTGTELYNSSDWDNQTRNSRADWSEVTVDVLAWLGRLEMNFDLMWPNEAARVRNGNKWQ